MHNFEDEEMKAAEVETETEIETETASEAEAEAAASDEPFNEEQLLELAQNEGLAENLQAEEEAESEDSPRRSSKVELTEEQQNEITASIETVLFMSDRPVSLPKLRSVINSEVPIATYRALMAKLREDFARDNRGVEIAEVSMGFQLRTKPHMTAVLRKMVKTQPLKLSASNMEVLAICAYKQPVTKDEIDQIRGVDSGYVLRNLMEKRLVKITGRSDLPGKPMVYGTTHEFLELFNLKDLTAMPPLHEVESMVAASEIGTEEKMHTVMTEFGKILANNTKVLFDDSQVDTELEALRSEIASIPTSTAFIDEQKHKEKLQMKLDELALAGLTLDLDNNEVPINEEHPLRTAEDLIAARMIARQEAANAKAAEAATLAASVSETETEAEAEADSPLLTDGEYIGEPMIQFSEKTEESSEHSPSLELESEAAAAQWERHASMIAEAEFEVEVQTEIAAANAEALVEALDEVNHSDIDSESENEHKGDSESEPSL